jgi:hypothetical protein
VFSSARARIPAGDTTTEALGIGELDAVNLGSERRDRGRCCIRSRWARRRRRARRDAHHGIALPPANACTARGAVRSDGGARPIAICVARAAAAINDRLGAPSARRAASAHRVKVGHRVTDSVVMGHAQTWRRTAATGCRAIAHSVSAIAIAAWP